MPRTSTSRPATATCPPPASSTTTTTSSARGTATSPTTPSLWELPRFVDEVEQVRTALGLDSSNFYLLGQSWGGILAIEYALHHQQTPQGTRHLEHDVQLSRPTTTTPATS